jgi:GGDEF domain-containing protein
VAYVLQNVRAGAGRQSHLLFKIGGPLFGYCLPEASAPEARAVAEEIHEKVQQSETYLQRLTVSIGIINFYELFLEDGSPSKWLSVCGKPRCTV